MTVVPLLDMTENVFYMNRAGVWKLSLTDDGQTWWARNRLGKSWNGASFKPKRGDRLWLIENISSKYSRGDTFGSGRTVCSFHQQCWGRGTSAKLVESHTSTVFKKKLAQYTV